MTDYRFLIAPQYSTWRVWIAPGTCVAVTADRKIPNRFQRWMQERLLGWRWEDMSKEHGHD